MGTTVQKLQAVLNSKNAIKTAILKFKSDIGNRLSDYAPVISKMADLSNDLGEFVADSRAESITIPFKGETKLRPYLFYGVKADEIHIENGFTTTSTRQFTYLNNPDTIPCKLYLPNSITSFNTNNPWTGCYYIIPILEDGWKASITLAGNTQITITKAVLEDMIDAFADLTGETGQTFKLANASQYDLISAEKLAEATAKNWVVNY